MRLASPIAVAAALMAAGCVNVLPEVGPAPQVYRLDNGGAPNGAGERMQAAAFSATAAASSDMTLTVVPLLAPRALATDRLAVMTEDGHLSYAAGARWNQRAPELIQERFVTALEDDGRIGAVVRPEDGVRTRYELRLELLRFEAVYDRGDDAAPVAIVGFRGRLIERNARKLVASSRFEAETRASENRMAAVVDAFDAALDQATAEVVDWIIAAEAESAAEPAQPSASAASSSR